MPLCGTCHQSIKLCASPFLYNPCIFPEGTVVVVMVVGRVDLPSSSLVSLVYCWPLRAISEYIYTTPPHHRTVCTFSLAARLHAESTAKTTAYLHDRTGETLQCTMVFTLECNIQSTAACHSGTPRVYVLCKVETEASRLSTCKCTSCVEKMCTRIPSAAAWPFFVF